MRSAPPSRAGEEGTENNGFPCPAHAPSLALFVVDFKIPVKPLFLLFPLSAALFRSEDREPLLRTSLRPPLSVTDCPASAATRMLLRVTRRRTPEHLPHARRATGENPLAARCA
jgi:hypothetical protein